MENNLDDKYFGQQCQDNDINIAFRNLHKHLVDEIIKFCKYYNILIDEFHLDGDCFEESIKSGSWVPCSDSMFVFDKFTNDYKKAFCELDREFLESKTKEELYDIELDKKPFLISM